MNTGAHVLDVQAQKSAATQPIIVQPRKKFSKKMPSASRLLWPIIAGRKYKRTRTSRPIVAPLYLKLRCQQAKCSAEGSNSPLLPRASRISPDDPAGRSEEHTSE